ncbi:TonB-dependent receptor [Pontibacter rugosus]|uniref:TonB-dependent receptor domain-containing protein n=1 Tax=Pontibacter rugosus TaxID=1745966 RepID=A0ABW3SRH8_9BACT
MRVSILLVMCYLLGSMAVAAQQYGTVAGEVLGAAGRPVAYASVALAGKSGATADAAGSFKLSGLAAGTYTLQVSAVGYKPLKQEITIRPGEETYLKLQLEEQVSELGQVVVSATRMEQSAELVPIPVDVITKEQISQIGVVRLNEVLSEQTGLQLISNHGTGLQIQGLGSDYVLVLVDGEPVVGRTSGVLDLTRLAVGNIERVEVIKGPASSLYGSEAMAGVVNIITKKDTTPFAATVRGRYSTFQTLNTSADLNWQSSKAGLYLFADRLRSDGYDLSPETVGKTSPPFTSYTLNPKVYYNFSNRLSAHLSFRWYTEEQQNDYAITEGAQEQVLLDKSQREDWSLMPTLEYSFGNKHKLTLKNYSTSYKTDSRIAYTNDGALYDASYFNQFFNRSEAQLDLLLSDKHISTLGAGYTLEEVEATRYDYLNRMTASYIFGQHQWRPTDKLNVVAGARFDQHSQYASRFSPKLSAKYEVLPWLWVQGSFGGGYKAPDFRQLLLNFTNAVAGYSVFGSSVVQREMQRLQEQGQVAVVYIDPATISEIKAENSMAYNAGFTIKANQLLSLRTNFFRNNINDLIETAPVARKTNEQNVYGYFNVAKVYTQGAEVQLDLEPLPQLSFSLGYQCLDAKDAAVRDKIENGEVFKRDPATQEVKRVKLSDYGGLFNRSRHSGNVKLFYTNQQYGFNSAIRGIYRGRFGFGDLNGNQILDIDQEYAPTYFTWNVSAGKQLLKYLQLEAGVNNLFDTTSTYEPSLAGRTFYTGITFKINAN